MNELYHHGIKGQQWGKRRYQYEDGSLTPDGKARYASNYKPSQRAQDEIYYGRGGMERINKNVRDKGYNIKTARSVEAKRINDARKRATTMGQVGSLAGEAAGAIIGYKVVNKYLSNAGYDDITRLAVSTAASAGASLVAKNIGRSGGQAIGMLSSGYNPNKYRYAY